MKTKIQLLIVLFSIVINTGYSQELTTKELRESRKVIKQKQIKELIDSRDFVFIPTTVTASGFRSENISGGYYSVKFHPGLIESVMPFYGRAYTAVGITGDTGMRFSGKPDYTVLKNNDNYQIEAVVKANDDNYSISLSLSQEGNGSLTISSVKRSTISYLGEISGPSQRAGNQLLK
jgi:hypothetical protein